MQYVIANLLLFMNHEDAFWILTRLFNDRKYALGDIYSPQNCVRILTQCSEMTKKKAPAIYERLRHEYVEFTMFAIGWLRTIFILNWPLEVVESIWDLYFLYGEPILVKTVVAYLKIYEDKLCHLEFSELLQFILHYNENNCPEKTTFINTIISLKI